MSKGLDIIRSKMVLRANEIGSRRSLGINLMVEIVVVAMKDRKECIREVDANNGDENSDDDADDFKEGDE
jgi:hypothetical protein